jgi:Mn2+/Fe2+ NRAMP family transporter
MEKTELVTPSVDWLALLGMVGTTFSVAGAFYQAYLVKEKGWGISDAKDGVLDAFCSITLLGAVTCMVLLTSYCVFYGKAGVTLGSVGDVAVQLEPTFGVAARVVFASGILAGAISSFLVNALIGGTVLSDCLGLGAKLTDRWPVHLTAAALLIGMVVSGAAMLHENSTVMLITFAQALTVAGVPALALALIYLGTRPELTGERAIPRPVLGLAIVGFVMSCVLAVLTAQKVAAKVWPAQIAEQLESEAK